MERALNENEINSFKFFWKLENFCFCDFYCNRRLSSSTFRLSTPFQSEWYLYMFPNGYGVEKYVGIYLKRGKKNLEPQEVTVRFKISLMDSSGTLCPETTDIQERIFTKDCEWGYNEFIKLCDLNSDSGFLEQGTLTVVCNIKIVGSKSVSGMFCRRPSNQCRNMEGSQNIWNAMKSLYDNPNYSDIILRGKSKNFRIHKCILKTRMPIIFKKLQCSPDIIFQNDCVFEQVLLYLYTGKFDVNNLDSLDTKRNLDEYGLGDLYSRLVSHCNIFTALTYISIQKHKFSWTIIASTFDNEDQITSPLIPDACGKIGFTINLLKNENGLWNIEIKVISDDDVFVRCKISLHEEDANYFIECKGCNRHLQCNDLIQFVNNVLVFNQRTVPFFSDVIILDFVFTYPNGRIFPGLETVSSCYGSSTSYAIDDSEILLTDLERMYHEQNDTDVVVQVGSKKFNVHKCILCARSPVFRAMLEHSMLERNGNLIEMKNEYLDEDDFTEVVDKFLLYVYCGKFDSSCSDEFKVEFYSLLDMYLINKT